MVQKQYKLNKKEISILMNEKDKLTTSIINHVCTNIIYHSKYTFISPLFTMNLFNQIYQIGNQEKNWDKWFKRSVEKANPFKLNNCFIIPICTNDHWYLVKIENDIMYIYNSIPGLVDLNLLNELKDYFFKKVGIKIKTIETMKLKKQEDGISCGVYLLFYTYRISNCLDENHKINVIQWRKFFCDYFVC
jgi:hypothetical protein